MAKDKSKKPAAARTASDMQLKLTADKAKIDSTLASLFATSVGPAKPRPKEAYHQDPPKIAPDAEVDGEEDEDGVEEDDEEDLSSIDEELPDDDDEEEEDEDRDEARPDVEGASSDEDAEIPVHESLAAVRGENSQRKRKRKGDEDDLEEVYMRKLAKEEAKDEAKRKSERNSKRQKKENGGASEISDQSEDDKSKEASSEQVTSDEEHGQEDSSAGADAESDFEVPQHETQASEREDDTDLERASRTIFLGNVSIKAVSDKPAKKTLVKHMSSFLSELPKHDPPHKFESIRFRSTPFSTYIPKKAAYAKKEILEETAHSTNAYVVYSTQQAAREAARRLNGTVVLDRHLRVDVVAHPAKTDHRRCVFVGNLGFVDDESMIQEAEAKRIGKEIRKKKEPGDVEEGLWRTFGKVGTVESVRVVRDPKTRVGKGFAYVQFTDENAVEAALLYNDKKFPPMLPRKLRVVRAKAIKRNAKNNSTTSTRPVTSNGVYNRKISAEEKSLQGRAAKLLGKAGAAKVRSNSKPITKTRSKNDDKPANSFKSPEQFVFEGHRASEKQGKSGLKLGGKKKRGGKPTSRSSKRGAAWKAAGGKKA